MFLRALFAFSLLPGIVAFLVPFMLASFDPWRERTFWIGLPVITVGVVCLVCCVVDFYRAGKGTLAPWDPPKRLVIIGLYRLVRNPMYVSVIVLLVGWGIYFGSWLILAYAIVMFTAFHLRVVLYEEPKLSELFSDDWHRYRAAVGRWVPRTVSIRK